MNWLRKRPGRFLLLAITVLLTCTIAEIGGRSRWLGAYENAYYDLWHQLSGVRAAPEHGLIVTIDNQTLIEYKDEPMVFWGPHFARAVENLRMAGARVIGIDFMFTVSIESWLSRLDTPGSDLSRTYDIPFREQLNRGDVVLIATATVDEEGKNDILMPIPDYLYSLRNGPADIGLSNLYMDDDGVIRRFVPRLIDDGSGEMKGFGLILAAVMAIKAADSPEAVARIEQFLRSNTPFPIGFAGPPGTFPRISFHRLLEPGAENDPEIQKIINGKTVIISAEYAGTNDIHLTPYVPKIVTRGKSLMSGAEIHANIVETLLTGNFPRPIPLPLRLFWLIAVTGAGVILFFRVRALQGLLLLLFLMILSGAASFLMFTQNQILPVLNLQAALGLSYIAVLGLRLTSEEKRRSRMEMAIRPYVSDAVVDQVIARDRMPDLGGESMRVTVLFSDIRGFTTISEQLRAHEVVEMLNQYYTRVCEPILNRGGMVDKFIGDAVMALFGAPLPLPDHQERAVAAAWEMTRIAQDFNGWLQERFSDRNLPEFRIGVGIHSGEVVIGNIGSSRRMEYTAIGDTVNVASRLESLCKKFGWTIVASSAVADLAGPGVRIGKREKVTPTGRQGEIEVVEILGFDRKEDEVKKEGG